MLREIKQDVARPGGRTWWNATNRRQLYFFAAGVSFPSYTDCLSQSVLLLLLRRI